MQLCELWEVLSCMLQKQLLISLLLNSFSSFFYGFIDNRFYSYSIAFVFKKKFTLLQYICRHRINKKGGDKIKSI